MSRVFEDYTAQQSGLSEGYQEAISLHNQIVESGNTAATYLLEMARGLKRMRDQKLYTALGYTSFEDYAEQMAGIKQRQAYKYIATYERFGEKFLLDHGSLGITKLELLAQIPATDLTDFEEEHPVEDLSVSQLKELTEKYRNQGEQMSLLQDENDKLKAEQAKTPDSAAEITALQEKIAQLEQASTALPDEKELKKIQKEAEKAAKAKVQTDLDKAKRDAAEKIRKAETDAVSKIQKAEAERSAAEQRLQAISAEQSAAEERAKKLEKELRLTSSAATQEVMIHFDYLQSTVNKILTKIQQVKADDPETAVKLAGAMVKLFDKVEPAFRQLEGRHDLS